MKITYLKIIAVVFVFAIFPISVLAQDNIYVISGTVEGNTISLDPFLLLENDAEFEEPTGEAYEARFYKTNFFSSRGALLSRDVLLKKVRFETISENGLDIFVFSSRIPRDMKRMVFYKNNVLLKEFRISLNSPLVSHVNLEYISDESYLLSWSASDSDNDFLRYNIYYNSDSQDWKLYALNQESQNITVDLSMLPQGRYVFKVQVTDGFNVGEAISSEIETGNKPPRVFIDVQENSVFSQENLLLQGGAFDPESGFLNTGFSWESNINGFLSNEASFYPRLSLGRHIIALRATDGALMSEYYVPLTITGQTKPNSRISSFEVIQSYVENIRPAVIKAVLDVQNTESLNFLRVYVDNPETAAVYSSIVALSPYNSKTIHIPLNATFANHKVYATLNNIEEGLKWCNFADINGDSTVSIRDVSLMRPNLGRTNCSAGNNWCDFSDLNRDGKVDGSDASLIRSKIGTANCFDKDDAVLINVM